MASGKTIAGITTGKILQVLSTIKTDTFTVASATYTAVTGLNVTITPSSASSKILVMVQANVNGPSDNVGGFSIINYSNGGSRIMNHKAIYALYPNVVTIDDTAGAFDARWKSSYNR
jgi:hypothetical protein